jgi:para-nitrobenzyl esterase
VNAVINESSIVMKHIDRTAETRTVVGRRRWLKQAAALAGGTAAAAALPETELAAGQPSPKTPAPGVRVATADAGVVDTTAGKVRGFTRNGVYIYRGIPYGETTAGDARFLPPRKAQAWTGVRASTSWGPACPQAVRAGWRNDEEQFLYQWDDGFPGEDMLRLNVWTAGVNDNRRRPVLVWIHGGGFVSGSSQELRPYDGERLAGLHDVVLVSMNHRLNALGFLDLSQAGGEKYARSANVGMLDLVCALEWVRDNVGRFGGDPGNVTIFGQSGGGRKVSTLLAMPAAKGLFHKAAVFSGSHLRQGTTEQSRKLAAAVLEALNISGGDLSRLHQLPVEQLVQAGVEGLRKAGQGAAAGTAPAWGPVVDGTVLPAHAFDPGPPEIASQVPLLVGNTFQEFGGGMNDPAAASLTLEKLRERLRPQTGDRTDAIVAA